MISSNPPHFTNFANNIIAYFFWGEVFMRTIFKISSKVLQLTNFRKPSLSQVKAHCWSGCKTDLHLLVRVRPLSWWNSVLSIGWDARILCVRSNDCDSTLRLPGTYPLKLDSSCTFPSITVFLDHYWGKLARGGGSVFIDFSTIQASQRHGKSWKTWKMKKAFSRPGKIMEFEKKAKIMDKSWNFKIPLWKYHGKIFWAARALSKKFCAARTYSYDDNEIGVVVFSYFVEVWLKGVM